MADRTPRLAYANLLQLAATLLSVSSENLSFPRARVRTAFITDRWRSKQGWTVVAGFNDKLDFDEGGTNRVATLTAGTYTSGTSMAAMITNQMNAVAVSNTYTVTYSANTFTIARATGSTAFSLEFLTGANTATSIHLDLGYTTTDKTGSTSYAAEGLSFHTRAWMVFDLGSAQAITLLALIGHNLLSTGTVTMQANSSDAWTSPAFTQVLAGTTLRISFVASQSYRYWRALINDVANPAGYTEFGVPWGSTYFQPGRSFRQGFTEMNDDLSIVVQGDGGSFFTDQRGNRRQVQVTFPRLSRTDKLTFDTIAEAVGTGGHMLFALDPQNFAEADTIYGVFPDPFSYQHSVGDGSPPDRYTVSMRFVQEVN